MHRHKSTALDLASISSESVFRNEFEKRRMKWRGVLKYLFIAIAYSSTSINFDIFSKILFHVRFYDFVFYEVTFGITYMGIESFIKLYMKKIDFESSLNPILKSVNMGILIHTISFLAMNANSLNNSLKYLIMSMRSSPVWSICPKTSRGCITSKDVVLRCQANQTTLMENSSVHLSYMKMIMNIKDDEATKPFNLVLIWSIIFLLGTVSDTALFKIIKLGSFLRISSTICTVLILTLASFTNTKRALKHILSLHNTSDVLGTTGLFQVIAKVVYSYGIGLIGIFETNTFSHIIIDNAVVVFCFMFTVFAFLRSLILRTLFLEHLKCVGMGSLKGIDINYLIFAIVPLSAEFHSAQLFYLFYIYGNLTICLLCYLLLQTVTVAKLINSEFRSVKNVYMVGIVCLFLFFINLIFSDTAFENNMEIHCIVSLFLGAVKMAVISYIYGIDRFSTDIHFLLGFKPSKFWTVMWLLLPIILFSLFMTLFSDFVKKLQNTSLGDAFSGNMRIITSATIVLTVFFILLIKTVLNYLMNNNIMGLFRFKKIYGPPEPDNRRRRRDFNVTLHRRKCVHNCLVIDEKYYCNHLPVMSHQVQSPESVESLFDDKQMPRGSSLSTRMHL